MKIWNTVTVVIFAFGTSVIADPGSIRNVDDGKVELEEGGFTVSLVLFDAPLVFLLLFLLTARAHSTQPIYPDVDKTTSWKNPFVPSIDCNPLHRINGCHCYKDEQCNSGRCSKGFKCQDKVRFWVNGVNV